MKLNKSPVLLVASLFFLNLTACNDETPSIGVIATPDTLPIVVDPSATPRPSATPAATATPSPTAAPNADAKVALVYAGTGVCAEDCAAAAAESARLAGLTPRLVYNKSLPESATPEQIEAFYKNAVVWIEPGGYARNSWEGMTQALRTTLKEFIRGGGGYVGFCAGAFMATAKIGGTGASGLGIFPGNTYPYNGSTTVTVDWQGTQQKLYWEGGPYFYNLDSTVEVTGLYKNGSVAAARTQFGAGRVYLSGPHPEAPDWWFTSATSNGSVSGKQQQIAADMIKWAARLQ